MQRKACYLALGDHGWTASATCSACGSSRPRAPSSGCRCSTDLKTAWRPRHPDLLRGRPQRASPRRSRRSSQRRPCRRASCTSSDRALQLRPAPRSTTRSTKDLKPIYTAIDVGRRAGRRSRRFDEKWGSAVAAMIVQAWRDDLGVRHPVHGLRARRPPRDLHDERRSRRSTGSCERRSRPRDTSRTTRTATRKLIYPSRSINADPEMDPSRQPGRKRCWRSRSTSKTVYPIDAYTLRRTPSASTAERPGGRL